MGMHEADLMYMSWTHQDLNKTELHSFMASENNNPMITMALSKQN